MNNETIVTLLIGALATFFLFFKRGNKDFDAKEADLQDKIDNIKKEVDKIDKQLDNKVGELNDEQVVDYWKNKEK